MGWVPASGPLLPWGGLACIPRCGHSSRSEVGRDQSVLDTGLSFQVRRVTPPRVTFGEIGIIRLLAES